VTISDLMLSSDFMSAETSTTKFQTISSSGKWASMFAGSPSVNGGIMTSVYGLLEGKQESFDEVVAAFEKAFRLALKRKIDGELLSPYGLDRDAFFKRGRGYFGEEEFSRILYQLNAIKLETSFLVVGFDPNSFPQIFSVFDPGVFEDHNHLGFHAIGTGWMRALGSLYGTYDGDLSTLDLIYRLCEAKFLGESALGVGKDTFIDVISPDGTHQVLYPQQVEPIRSIWLKKEFRQFQLRHARKSRAHFTKLGGQ